MKPDNFTSMTTKKEGVITVYNESKELVSIMILDEETRHNLVYVVKQAGLEEMEALINAKTA